MKCGRRARRPRRRRMPRSYPEESESLAGHDGRRWDGDVVSSGDFEARQPGDVHCSGRDEPTLILASTWQGDPRRPGHRPAVGAGGSSAGPGDLPARHKRYLKPSGEIV